MKMPVIVFLLTAMIQTAALGAESDVIIHGPQNGLGDSDVFALTVIGERLWAGTANGLSCLERGADRWQTFRRDGGPGRNFITCLARDGKMLWVGTEQGLALFDMERRKWADLTMGKTPLGKRYISALLVERDHVWVGLWRLGLYRLDKLGKKGRGAAPVELPATKAGKPRSAYALADGGDSVYVGTERGLLIHGKADKSWRDITIADGLASNMISTLTNDGNTLWIGTGAGPARYHKATAKLSVWTASKVHRDRKANTTTYMPSARGCRIAHSVIATILVDGDRIWIGSFRKGIVGFDKRSDKWLDRQMSLGGLRAKGAHAIAVQGDRMWWATPTTYYGKGLLLISKKQMFP